MRLGRGVRDAPSAGPRTRSPGCGGASAGRSTSAWAIPPAGKRLWSATLDAGDRVVCLLVDAGQRLVQAQYVAGAPELA